MDFEVRRLGIRPTQTPIRVSLLVIYANRVRLHRHRRQGHSERIYSNMLLWAAGAGPDGPLSIPAGLFRALLRRESPMLLCATREVKILRDYP